MIAFLITTLITAVSLLIISKLPLGVQIDNLGKALLSAVVFGLLNALVKPVLAFLAFPITILTLGLFSLVLNVIIFALAAWLVRGFELRWGIWSAILGTIALSIVNSILNQVVLPLAPTLR